MAFNTVFVLTTLTVTFMSVYGDSKRCPTDIIFLVDQSTSITRVLFNNKVKPFLAHSVNTLNIDKDADRVSVIRFSSPDKTGVDFHFDNNFDKQKLLETIAKLGYAGGNTATVKALNLAQSSFFDSSAARNNEYEKNTVVPVAVIVTDGVATDGDAASIAKQLSVKGVQVFAVGVGAMSASHYLQELTGDASRVFAVEDTNGFTSELVKVIEASTTCT